MDSVVKWGLILGGGYLVAKTLGYDPLSMFSAIATPAVATNTTNATQTSTPAAAVSQASTLQKVTNAIVQAGGNPNDYFTVDTLNYYYNMVRGISGPAPETLFPGVDRNTKHSIAEWWTAMTGQGFSGFGVIANHVDPYTNVQGTPFGSNISPIGSERFNVRIN
jgi:hypothetical protein